MIAPVAALEAVSITQLLIKNYQPKESTRKAEQNLSDKLKPENFDDEVDNYRANESAENF